MENSAEDDDALASLHFTQTTHQHHHHHFKIDRRGESEKKSAVLELNVNVHALAEFNHALSVEALLEDIGERIHHRLRENDVVLPMGGDKFVILLEDVASLANADAVAHELMCLVHSPFAMTQQTENHLGATISISFFTELELELVNFPRHKKHKIFDIREHLHKISDDKDD